MFNPSTISFTKSKITSPIQKKNPSVLIDLTQLPSARLRASSTGSCVSNPTHAAGDNDHMPSQGKLQEYI